MTKFLVIIFATLFVSFTTFAYAKSDKAENPNSGHGNEQSQSENHGNPENNGKSKVELENVELKVPSRVELEHGPSLNRGQGKPSSPSAQIVCDPNANWKNHGEYVSCVAKLHLGGQSVSEAARSDIGKKNASSSGIPGATGSASPSASDSATPDASESGTELLRENVRHQALNILTSIQTLMEKLQNLFKF